MTKQFYPVWIFFIAAITLIPGAFPLKAQVSVTASAGTAGPTSYTTLNDAFIAINAGTHMGVIAVDITANTTEAGPCILNSSGAGSASYTSVGIRPTTDGVSISGATTTGRGLIELKGADNVTIDGDNPLTSGTNLNLSIVNTAANTITYTSCIRVALAATVVTSADNITIRNCIITGSATGRNISSATSATGSENTTFGIYVGGNGGTTAIDAPTALASVTANNAPNGTTANTFLVSNNQVNACARGIVFNGASTSVSSSVTVSNNTLGNAAALAGSPPYTTPSTTVYTKGIWVSGTVAVSVTGNTIQNELSYATIIMTAIELTTAIGTGPISISNNTINGLCQNAAVAQAVKAILISNAGGAYTISGNSITNVRGVQSGFMASTTVVGIEVNTAAPSGKIELNKIKTIYNHNPGTTGCYGINVLTGNNISIVNNSISDLTQDMTGGYGFNPQYAPVGIRINAGTGHKLYFNSIHLGAALLGTAASDLLSAAFSIGSSGVTDLDVRNNVFSNTMTGGTTNIAHVSIYLPTGATSVMNLTLNNNFYYCGAAASQAIAQVGTTPTTGMYLPGNFNAGAITPAANLRAYTSTLSGAGTNDNVSGVSSTAAPFTSATDLHIVGVAANATDLDNKAVPISGVTTDLDAVTRHVSTPDIGAYEFTAICSGANGGTAVSSSYSVCAGQAVTLSSTGVSSGGGITYQWQVATLSGGPYSNVSGGTGATTASFATGALTAGTYYYVLQVTCSAGPVIGLSNEITVKVNAPPAVVANASSPAICIGSSTTLYGSGANSYTWTGGVTDNVTFSPTSTNTYTVTGTDNNTCQNTATITVTVNSLPVVVANASVATICSGSSTTLYGGGANSYTWTGGATDNVAFSPTSTNTYTVTGTDNNTCQNTATITVTVNPLPVVVANVSVSTLCSGFSTTLYGGGASSYTWSGGVTDNVAFSPTSTNTYTVTGTDNNSCQNTATITVTVNPLPLVVANATSATICTGSSTKLFGSGANSYSWSGGVTDNVAFSPTSTNTYTVTGTDNNTCQNTATISVTVNPLPVVVANASVATICSGSSTTLYGGGASSYTWSGGVVNNVAFNPTSTNTYTVTGTDNNACQNKAMITVTVNSLPVVVANVSLATICNGSSTTLYGSGASSYTWSGGVTDNVTFSPTSTNTYTVTGTDNNTCQNTATVMVTVNPLPPVVANVSAATICIGSSTKLYGSGASSYTWSGGVTDNVVFSPTSTNTYTVTGTDNNSCQNTAAITVTVNPLPVVVANASLATICSGSATTLYGSGASSYTWSGGVTDNVAFSPTSTNTYTVTGTDNNSCQNTATVTVTVNPFPVVVANASLATICSGSATTLYGGGASTYVWSGGVTDNVAFSPTSTNTYTVTGTDNNSCQNTATITITVNPLPLVVANASLTTICAGYSTTLYGIGAGSYVWSGGVTDNVAFSPTSTNTYTVTGTDNNSCQNTATIEVVVNSLPTVVANASLTTICIGSSTTLYGGGASSYAWSGGVTDNVAFSPTSTNTYTVAGTDNNSCQNTATITVTVNQLPSVVANASVTTICSGFSTTLYGGGASTYAWSGGVTDNVAFSPTSTNTYTVTGTDNNSCQNTATVTVTVNPLPTVVANASATTICTGSSITLYGSGANSYTWSGGVVDNIAFSPASSNTYTVTGTDNNTCQNTAVITVVVNSSPAVTLNLATDTVLINGGIVTLSGGSPAGGTWSGTGVTGSTFDPQVTGTGTVQITYTYTNDLNGCTASATQTLYVVSPTAVNNGDALIGLNIYPNPTQGNFIIEFPASSSLPVKVEIINGLGNAVSSFIMVNDAVRVNLETQAAGMYLIRLTGQDGTSTYRRLVHE